MRFEEIKEQAIESGKFYLEKVKESPTFIHLQERYEELNPNVQRILKYAAVFFLIYFVFSIPLGWNQQANESLNRYDSNRKLIEDLLNVQVDLQSAPDINININNMQLQQQATDVIDKSGLSKEQIVSNSPVSSAARPLNFLPDAVNYIGVEIALNKLNLTQVLDIGTKLQNINRSAKLIELDMQANKEDNHYYDVKFLLASFTGTGTNE